MWLDCQEGLVWSGANRPLCDFNVISLLLKTGQRQRRRFSRARGGPVHCPGHGASVLPSGYRCNRILTSRLVLCMHLIPNCLGSLLLFFPVCAFTTLSCVLLMSSHTGRLATFRDRGTAVTGAVPVAGKRKLQRHGADDDEDDDESEVFVCGEHPPLPCPQIV
jgi:hypothetical protein